MSALALIGASATAASADHNADDHSPQAQALANIPRSSDFQFGIPPAASFQSDLAFTGDLAIAGNYNGFRVIDVSIRRTRAWCVMCGALARRTTCPSGGI